ncbi:protein phosphatase 2C domain-containing protein [Amycolatopsis sp. lyj-346]|uniref:protein phosphatase 2C domain-containing protein n=1 Tax=Amycolatopsis sp. lyj-346 TaxID=2789289 RepID=UPI00397DB8D2
MQVAYATWAGPGRANEDLVVATNDSVVLLDGATTMVPDTGCVHDVVWFVGQLGTVLTTRLTTDPGTAAAPALADAIAAVRRSHEDTCDLAHVDSPTAAVAVLLARGERLDYLVLCDTTVAFRLRDGRILVVTDERIRQLPDDYQLTKRLLRNRSGGFWVAGADPAAAGHALQGGVSTSDVDSVLVLTDGVTRLVERYETTWPELFRLAESGGPETVLARLRRAESAEPGRFPGKLHDDATIVFCAVTTQGGTP